MTDRMVNGILFIIAGLGSIAVYLALGETGLLDKGHTEKIAAYTLVTICLLYTSPSPRDGLLSRMPSSA